MSGNHHISKWILVLTLVFIISIAFLTAVVSAEGMETLKDIQDTISEASTLNEQLGILYDASFRFSDELETAGWDVSLSFAPAEELPEDLIYTKEVIDAMESTTLSVSDLEGSKIICLFNDAGKTKLLGDFQVRIPENLRAASIEEADTLLYMLHYTTSRSDYIGSASDRHYDVYIIRREENTCCTIYYKRTTPPVTGYGALSGESVPLSDLWNGTRPWFYGTIEIQYPEGTATYRITGNTCCLAALDGEFVRYEIPESVNGYPVTGIEECNCETLEELVLPEGIVWIQKISSKNLKTMNFPSTVRRITGSVTSSLKNLILNEGLEEIGDFALLYADGENFFLPSTLKSVGRGTLEHGSDCVRVIIPEGMTALPDFFMTDADNLLAVYIPASITSFGSDLLNYGTCRIFAPEGSRAASWAKYNEYNWTPCESPEDMPQVYLGDENGFQYGIVGDEAVLIGYTGSNENVFIPETLGGYPVTSIHCYAFSQNNAIRSIVIPETVTELQSWFADFCYGLKEIYIPSSVTLHHLGSYWQHTYLDPENIIYVQNDSPIAKEWEDTENDFSWAIWTPGAEKQPQEDLFVWSNEQLEALKTPGQTICFGHWELNENEADGPEQIEWIVLAAEDGRSLLVSKNAISKLRFDDSAYSHSYMIWSLSSIRKWLQTECFDTMFTRSERTMIQSVLHDTLPEKIFLLSTDEADSYFESDEARQCLFIENGEEKNDSWWLRTSSTAKGQSNYLADVLMEGTIHYNGSYYEGKKLIRPAIWVTY